MKTFDKLDKLGIKNAFISKPYDFSCENKNRKKDVSKLLKVKEDKVFFCNQAHTNIVSISSLYSENDECDGLITNEKGTTLCVYLADCQGIFLYDDVKKVIGVVHSGWRGTFGKIVLNAINLMEKEYGTNKKDILCFFSPSIHSCHFEVSEDFLKNADLNDYIVDKKIKNGKFKYFIDLVSFNKDILIKEGIRKNNIFDMNECTVCADYYSYRKDKTKKRNGFIISL